MYKSHKGKKMTGLYIKIIRLLAKNEYDLKARYFPALIFSILLALMLYVCFQETLDFGWLDFLKLPLFIITALLFALIPKIIAPTVSGYIQTAYWNKYGNTTVKYIQRSNKKIHIELLSLFDDTDILMHDMLAVTREDKKLLAKNIFYGFMRNLSFLAVLLLVINAAYFQYALIINMVTCLILFLLLYISAQRYAEQITNSYLELKIGNRNDNF